jgi:hypothetical protein
MKVLRLAYAWISFLGILLAAAMPARADAALLKPETVMEELRDGLTVEFRAGDRLPVVFKSEGDFLETLDPTPSMVVVRRGFYLRFTQKEFLMSLDGREFQPISKLVGGNLNVGISPDPAQPVAAGVQVLLQSFLKK